MKNFSINGITRAFANVLLAVRSFSVEQKGKLPNNHPLNRLTEEGKKVALKNDGLPIPQHINDKIMALINSGKSQDERNILSIPLFDEVESYHRQVGWLR